MSDAPNPPILPLDQREPEPPDAPYRDAARAVEDRVEDLLGRMSLAEKISQLTSAWITYDPDSGAVAPSNFGGIFGGDAALEEVLHHGVGQITRPLGSRPIEPRAGAAMINELQRRMVEDTRLGIPAICHEECLTGLMAQGATSFPSPLNFASTWDPDLIERVGSVIRRQMRSVGTHQGLAPVADVARDARWGRVEETLGEEPYLVGEMVTAYVRGLQGDDPRTGVIATLKHFVGYSGSEGGRNFAPTHAGRRELEDVFFPPFERAVKEGGALSVMNSYQEIDGEAPAASRWLLTEVLRNRWGFDGFVVADYGAVSFLHQFHKVAADATEASAKALWAGLDVELPGPEDYPRGLPPALEAGLCTIDDVDQAVRRVLTQKFRLGLFEEPYVDIDRVDLDGPDDRALAAEVAARSITLLSNDGTLPLSPASALRVAVLGPNADDIMALFGNYSYENHVVSTHFPEARDSIEAPTVLEALRNRFGAASVSHAEGCQVMSDDEVGVSEAIGLAAEADVAVVVVGDKAGHFRLGTVGEGTDTADLSLPGAQGALVRAVIDTGTPTVVVLLNGRPFALGDIAERAAAIVEAWFPGQAGAEAIADVLVGAVDPGGRSPLTFSASAGAQPTFVGHKFLSPGFPRLPEYTPVFHFGHGLSYTTFAYSDLQVTESVPIDSVIGVECTVTNTGSRAGTEVVQLYTHDPVASVTRPVRELRGFVRVDLEPGASARVRFGVPTALLSFSGPAYERIVEPGVVQMMIGRSSADIQLEADVELVGEMRVVGEERPLGSTVAVDLS